MPYSAKFWQGKALANRSFQSFGEEIVGDFTIATLVNLEFGWVKYWQLTFISPNWPKFPMPDFLFYTVIVKVFS